MTLLTTVQDVCAQVGVVRPTSVFSGLNGNRTMQEMLALANEMAQRIAYDTRDWTALLTYLNLDATSGNIDINFNQEVFALPADFKRLTRTSNIWRPTMPQAPLRFVPDHDEWAQRRLWGWYDYRGEWNKLGNQIWVAPALITTWINGRAYAVGDKAADNSIVGATTYWSAAVKHTSASAGTFAAARAANPSLWTTLLAPSGSSIVVSGYLTKNCVILAGGGYGEAFISDADTFMLNERLLKLGMIWQWKASKGSPYAEDMGTYNDALNVEAGADKPAPIIIDRLPSSWSGRAAYPWPVPTP